MNMKANTALAIFAFIITLGLFAVQGISFAEAQETGTPAVAVPEDLSPEAISALVSKLDPDQTEALTSLVKLLNNSIGDDAGVSGSAQVGALEILKHWLVGFGDAVVVYVAKTPEMIAGVGKGYASIFAGRGFAGSAVFLFMLALVIAAGMAGEWVFKRVTAAKREQIRNSTPVTLLETLKTLSTRAVIEIGGVVVFTIAALLFARILLPESSDRFIAFTFILQCILVFRIVLAMFHFILAPRRTDLRLVYTDDWTAQFTYRNFAILGGVLGVAFFTHTILFDRGIAVGDTFRFWMSLLFHGGIIYVTWKAREGFTSMIIGEEENLTPGLERMAAWWPKISMAIIAFNFLLVQFIVSTGYQDLTPGRGALAILLIVMMPFLDTIVRGVAAHLVPAMKGEGTVAEKAQQNNRLCYVRVGRVILLASLIIIIGKLWGINLRDLAESGLGAQFAANVVGFLLILAVGYIAWEITNLVINKKLAAEMEASGLGGDSEGGDGGGSGQSRMASILPIVRMTLQATIIILTVLLALSQLGVNITPLLAGAGVLGLAIGFGAQTLVKDIVSGVFFLLDDAFRVGEYIDVGGTQGTVEKISVRSLQLRAVLGPIHIVPYGSMSKLTNMSRDWVTMKLKFTIPFDTDLEKVRKLFKKIGQQMLEDPELAGKFLEPFKGQGAADITDTGIVVRGKFTTRPGDQWPVRKEIYNRVQRAFKENGIEFARKEVRVAMSEAEHADLSPEQKKAVAAAVSEAAEKESQAKQQAPGDDR